MNDPANLGPPKRRSPDAPRRQTAQEGDWLIAPRYMTTGRQLQSGETLVRSQHRALSIGVVVSHLGPANPPYRRHPQRHPQRHPRTSPSSVPMVGAGGIRVTLTPLNVTLAPISVIPESFPWISMTFLALTISPVGRSLSFLTLAISLSRGWATWRPAGHPSASSAPRSGSCHHSVRSEEKRPSRRSSVLCPPWRGRRTRRGSSLCRRRGTVVVPGPFRDLGVRIGGVVHRAGVQARVVRLVDCRGHFGARFPALSSTNRQLDRPHIRLTQRGNGNSMS